MVNKLSILLSTLGIGVCLLGLTVSDHLIPFGIMSILASAAIFILNWKNGLKSLLAATYLILFFVALYLGHRFVMFEGWFMWGALFFIPVFCLFLGCKFTVGTLKEKLKSCMAYILCIVSIWLGIFVFIFLLSAGV